MTLNERMTLSENKIKQLTEIINSLTKDKVKESPQPTSKVGGAIDTSVIKPGALSGGRVIGGAVIWNDSEMKFPPINEEPELPTQGYNLHVHSEFSGGALLIGATQCIELEVGTVTNIHSPNFWQDSKIATVVNTAGETVEKKGLLQLSFNADSKTWGIGDIDVKTVNFVMLNSDGTIQTDANGVEMKAPIYNVDLKKTSIIWDVNGACWRFYSVYSS